MAAVFYVCSILICGLCVQAMQSIKVLYCQDPDTGELHPVNSTWPSKSFCGNYTCKVRRKNVSSESISPIKKINITNINISVMNSLEDMSQSASEQMNVGMRMNPGLTHLINRDSNANKKHKQKPVEKPQTNTQGDGYLTESEIKTITDMLHTVKRSDLEAIVDIYNLAQDIYKEFDQNQGEAFLQDTMTPIRTHDNVNQEISREKGVSYWYEPLNFHNAKVKSQKDADSEAMTSSTTTQTIKSQDNSNLYFKGSLTDKDFRNLPYYYPSNFQKIPSYTNDKHNDPQAAGAEGKPCKKPATSFNNYVLPPWINSLKKHYATVTQQNGFEPSLLLPFPFAYVNNNNLSGYPPNVYYNSYNGWPWAHVNVYDRTRNYQHSYLGTAYAQIPSETVFVKPQVDKEHELNHNGITKEDIIDIISNLKDKEMNKMPDWKTQPLPEKVIEEVRGNAEKSKLLKSYPLKRKIKLERVDKVIKLDENLRSKRSVDEIKSTLVEEDEEETYLDKTTLMPVKLHGKNTDHLIYLGDERSTELSTLPVVVYCYGCEPSTELGFFRRGNMSESFPACCPVLIKKENA